MAQPIEAYFWPTPNGRKLTIALEEMRLPYVLKPVDIDAGDQYTPAFTKISPNNRMPAIIDPRGPGGKPISIFESGAILQYLGRKSGRCYPRNDRKRVEIDQWVFWQVGGLGPMAGQAGHFRHDAKVSDPAQLAYGRERYEKEVYRLYAVMERQLDQCEFLVGEFSIADIACWPWLRGGYQQNLEPYPKLKVWFERIAIRPAVVRALDAGEAMRREARAARTNAAIPKQG